MDKNSEYINRGYLKNDFQIFHIRDKKQLEFEFHYHEFDKIIIFIAGDVTYLIEGRSYKLKPWDILFVGSSDIHRPIINSEEIYERIVIWINSNFLRSHSSEDCNLLYCIEDASKLKRNLLRLNIDNVAVMKKILQQLEATFIDKEFGAGVLKNSIFMNFIVHLNRMYLGNHKDAAFGYETSDERILKIIDYINENLDEELSIDKLAEKIFVNKYYLMHRFKQQTGCTIHTYISQKRLMLAADMLRRGKKPLEIYNQCGFMDYSVFHRAFKKQYGVAPKHYANINSI